MGKRKYELNENYFEVIDSEEKAYILGFIYADGNIQSQGVDKKYRLRIGLKYQESERLLLERFKCELGYSGPIRCEIKRTLNNYKVYILDINSKKLICDLNRLGVFPKKTNIIKFPNINKVFYKDFIRGFSDGDGCISERKSRPNGFKFELCCANYEFMKTLTDVFYSELNITTNIKTYNKSKNVLYRIVKDKNDAKKILDYLYQDSNIHLVRKYELYKRFTAPLNRDI